jgi:hypothetical protein
MKKLGKLQINPEKLMKIEELVALKGGWSGVCEVICPTKYFNGPASGSSCENAEDICTNYWHDWDTGCYCECGCEWY